MHVGEYYSALSKLVNGFPDKSSTDDSDSKLRLLQDDRLLLVLGYPQAFSLTKRAILGELRSLNEPGKPGYFEPVDIISQLNSFSRYKFSSEIHNFSVYIDEVEEDGATTFSNSEICEVLRGYSGRLFRITPNWRFTSRDVFGPFFSGQENRMIGRSYKNVWLMLQNIICEYETDTNRDKQRQGCCSVESNSYRIQQNTVVEMTLLVEGIWDASKGQLCMVGCPGVVNSGLEGYDSRLSLYFPRSFSIKQSSIILGSISSFSGNSYDPILFDLEVRPSSLRNGYDQHFRSYLSYNYSMIELARAIRARNQQFRFISVIKQLFLSYPGGRSLLSVLISDIRQNFLTYSASHQDKDDLLSHQEIISLA